LFYVQLLYVHMHVIDRRMNRLRGMLVHYLCQASY